jgi:polysaccharide biosynthesis protein PslH
MRILWLNAGLLLPLDKGGKLRTWHLMRHLARHHSITYVSFADPRATQADRDGMRAVCDELHVVPRTDPLKGSPTFYLDAARRLFDPLPYAAGKYRSREYAERVAELLGSGRFDLVVCDFLVPAVNMPANLPCPAVVFTHNVESEIWRRHLERQSNPASRLLYRQQWRRMLRFEEGTLARFDLVLAVSDTDRATFQRLYSKALRKPIFTVATGVDTDYFAPRAADAVDPRHLVFTGSMDWIPNEDAMMYFCREVLPLVRRQEPGATLSIVGRGPTPTVQQLAGIEGITVTGRVDDVREYVGRAGVYIVPIRIGGGTRLKIFEAMGMARAVVSTTIGAEGLPVTDGRDIVIADTPRTFADAVVTLIREPARRAQLERAARDLVVTRYDWSAVAGQLEEALVIAASRSGAAAA